MCLYINQTATVREKKRLEKAGSRVYYKSLRKPLSFSWSGELSQYYTSPYKLILVKPDQNGFVKAAGRLARDTVIQAGAIHVCMSRSVAQSKMGDTVVKVIGHAEDFIAVGARGDVAFKRVQYPPNSPVVRLQKQNAKARRTTKNKH